LIVLSPKRFGSYLGALMLYFICGSLVMQWRNIVAAAFLMSLWKTHSEMDLRGKQWIKHGAGLGSCNIYPEKIATDLRRVEISIAGHEPSAAQLQEGGITANCLEGLESDAE
jgi:hypothetical protein